MSCWKFHLNTSTDQGDDSDEGDLEATDAQETDEVRAFIVIMNFEPELRYHFYCIFVLIKFIAVRVVFKLGIFRVINLLRISSQNL